MAHLQGLNEEASVPGEIQAAPVSVAAPPYSRDHRVQWMLEELGIPYEFIKLDFTTREHCSPEMRKLNPSARIPVLIDGELAVWESAAICTYLGDKFPDRGLVPAACTPERAHYCQWVSFATGELEGQMLIIKKAEAPHYFPEIVPSVPVEPSQLEPAVRLALGEFTNFARVLEEHLADRPFLVGDRFTAADILLWWVLNGAEGSGWLEGLPRLRRYVEELAQRPAFPAPPRSRTRSLREASSSPSD